MLFHQFGKHGVFALQLGFELIDLAFPGVFDSLGTAAVLKSEMAVFEELLEPVVNLGGLNVEFIAQVGDRHLFEQVPL